MIYLFLIQHSRVFIIIRKAYHIFNVNTLNFIVFKNDLGINNQIGTKN
jgi:hypothetical protein